MHFKMDRYGLGAVDKAWCLGAPRLGAWCSCLSFIWNTVQNVGLYVKST